MSRKKAEPFIITVPEELRPLPERLYSTVTPDDEVKVAAALRIISFADGAACTPMEAQNSKITTVSRPMLIWWRCVMLSLLFELITVLLF